MNGQCLRTPTDSSSSSSEAVQPLHKKRAGTIMKSNQCHREEWDHTGLSQPQLEERGISSMEEYIARRKGRIQQRDALLSFLARPDVSGQDKGWERCAYIMRNGRLPFQCQKCFMLPGNCVCKRLRRFKPQTKVVINLHPDEWGKGSNTGGLCAEAFSEAGAVMLMRGHKAHDEQLQQLLENPAYTCAMLWPGEGALEPQQLLEYCRERGTKIALIAIDATWDCARKMKSKYPPGVLMLKLPAHLALPNPNADAAAMEQRQQQQQQQQQRPLPQPAAGQQAPAAAESGHGVAAAQPSAYGNSSNGGNHSKAHSISSGSSSSSESQPVSLFRPLRKYKGNAAENGRVCTLEAVAGALFALEGDQDMYDGLLYNLKLKVDAMRRQKHMAEVYGIESL